MVAYRRARIEDSIQPAPRVAHAVVCRPGDEAPAALDRGPDADRERRRRLPDLRAGADGERRERLPVDDVENPTLPRFQPESLSALAPSVTTTLRATHVARDRRLAISPTL